MSVPEPVTTAGQSRSGESRPSTTIVPRAATIYVAMVSALSVLVGGVSLVWGRWPDLGPLLLLSALGILSCNLREPDVGSRVSFSFLSIVLLASASILGPFGAWFVGFVSFAIVGRDDRLFQRVFNTAMTSIIGAAGAWAYVLARGAGDVGSLVGLKPLVVAVGIPLIVADIVQCLVNAVLLSGVMHFHGGAPFGVLVRRILTTSGIAYVGYGVIGFLFVILWFPAELGAFSAVLVIVPLLTARWAFIQYGEELRSHERTIETLVTALGRKDPGAAARSRSSARIAEWIAEELALAPSQLGTVRYAAILHEVGRLGVPTRLLRQNADSLTDTERRVLAQHCAIGARMIDGIDFLDDARSGIRHQDERYDGSGSPDGLAGHDIPVAARVVAVAGRFVELTEEGVGQTSLSPLAAFQVLASEVGRYDPMVLDAARVVLDRHGWAALAPDAD